MNQINCKWGWVMMYDSYPRVSKKILSILLIGLLLISPSVALAQQGTPPLPIETQADQLQQAADSAIVAAQAAVTAAQQAAQQAAQAKAQAAAARERANALDAQAALSSAADAERMADAAIAQAQSALSAAREALAQSARAVTVLKEAQAAYRSASVTAAQSATVAQANLGTLSQAYIESDNRLTQVSASLQAAQSTVAKLSGEVDLYRAGLLALAVAVIGLLAMSAFFAGKARPVVVPVTVSDTPVARTTIDNGTAEEVPGATIVLSPDMRRHIDKLIANVG